MSDINLTQLHASMYMEDGKKRKPTASKGAFATMVKKSDIENIRQEVLESYPKAKQRDIIYRNTSQKCEAHACIRFLTNKIYHKMDEIDDALKFIAIICDKWGINYKALVQRTFTKP